MSYYNYIYYFSYFRLHTFPSEKKRPQERSKWQKLINRSSPSKNRKGSLFTIKSKMRVCSKHFIDKEPTYEHPYPTEELGYDPSHRLSTLVDSSSSYSRRKLLYTPSSNSKKLPSEKKTLQNDMAESEIIENPFQSPCSSSDLVNNQSTPYAISSFSTYSSVSTENKDLSVDLIIEATEIECNTNNPISKELLSEIDELKSKLNEQTLKNQKLVKEIAKVNQENGIIKSHLNNSNNQMLQMRKTIKILHQNAMKCKCKHPLYKQLLKSNRKCDYYTGIQTLKQFEKIYDIVSPFIQRRWRGKKISSTRIVRKFRAIPKKFGPGRKLCGKDELLLMLMKLRQGMLTEDIADRFDISIGLASNIITTWVKAASAVLKPMIFVPDREVIYKILPNRFKSKSLNFRWHRSFH